jgi:hypothetical protein
MVKAQGLIVIPRDMKGVPAGEVVSVILLDPTFFHTPMPSYLSFAEAG